MTDVTTCSHCKADLTLDDSVVRVYVNKDGKTDEDNIQAEGKYLTDGTFESTSFSGFPEGRFDLLDDSDSCNTCDTPT